MNPKETWLLWNDGDHSPFMNMAVDELLLEHSADNKVPLIRFYGWDRPSVSIGYVQSYNAAPHDKYIVVRRPTGGGIVYHDSDMTYTAAIPPEHPLNKLGRMESYRVFHSAILNALSNFGLEPSLTEQEIKSVDRATMRCFTTPTRYDVICDGVKYAGAAQRRTRRGLLHQGSVSLKATKGNKNKLTETVISGIIREFMIQFSDFTPDNAFLEKASRLAEKKYGTDEWNINKNYG